MANNNIVFWTPKGFSEDSLAEQAAMNLGQSQVQLIDIKDVDSKKLAGQQASPAIPVGTEVVFSGRLATVITSSTRAGQPDFEWLAELAWDRQGRVLAIPHKALMSGWITVDSDDTNRDIDDKSIGKLKEFWAANDNKTIVNSPTNGFGWEMPLDERRAKFIGKPVKLVASVRVMGTYTTPDETKVFGQRLYAFEAMTDAKSKSFMKDLDTAIAAAKKA